MIGPDLGQLVGRGQPAHHRVPVGLERRDRLRRHLDVGGQQGHAHVSMTMTGGSSMPCCSAHIIR